MSTFFSIINPVDFMEQTTIEIDSNKRELYENELFDLLNDEPNSLNSILIICNQTGDHFYLSKELAKKYLIKINTEF